MVPENGYGFCLGVWIGAEWELIKVGQKRAGFGRKVWKEEIWGNQIPFIQNLSDEQIQLL